LGLNITPSGNLGVTNIIRGHQTQGGSGNFVGNSSVFRYYDIQPTTYQNSLFTFNYYPAWELNGHIDGSLIAYQQVQYSWGGWLGPVYWEPLSTVNASPAANATTVATVLQNNVRITLGSLLDPLPVELSSFEAICHEDYKEITWKTFSEINNDYFVIEKSYDNNLFVELGNIPGNLNSNTIQNYSVIDLDLAPCYYRIKQFDVDGTETISNVIFSDCSEENQANLYYFQKEEELILVLESFPNKKFNILFYNSHGQSVFNDIIYPENIKTNYKLNRNYMSAGAYYVSIYNSDMKFTKKIIIY